MSTTRWRFAIFGSLLLASVAMLGFRSRPSGIALGNRVLWQGEDAVKSVAFSPDGTRLAFGTGVLGGSDGVGVVELAGGDEVASFAGHRNQVLCLAFSAEGRTLTTASYEAVKRWDLTLGRERAAPPGPAPQFSPSLALSHDGRLLAVATMPMGTARVVPLAGEPAPFADGDSPGGVTCLAFAPDGRSLAGGCADGTVRVWGFGHPRWRTLRPAGQSITAVAISPDVRTVAAASTEGKGGVIRLWDLAAGTERALAGSHAADIICLAFSGDGGTLASGSRDETIRLWDAASGAERAALRGHTDQVNAVAFAPDGQALASGSADKTVRLWEVGADR